MYFKDFASGAMIENIVRRAKKLAIKRRIADRREGHPHRRPDRLDPPGVQGARGPAQHHQPGRLGEDLGQEGRADRLHPHAHQTGRGRARGRPIHRAGGHALAAELQARRRRRVPRPPPAGRLDRVRSLTRPVSRPTGRRLLRRHAANHHHPAADRRGRPPARRPRCRRTIRWACSWTQPDFADASWTVTRAPVGYTTQRHRRASTIPA